MTAQHLDAEAFVSERPRRAQRRIRRGVYRRFSVALLAVLVLLVLFQYPGHALASRLGIVSTPQRFTELYFVDPAHLPDAATSGFLQFAFVIHNSERSRWIYSWSVLALAGKHRTQLTSGTSRLEDGRSSELHVIIAAARLRGMSMVEVRLHLPSQSIDLHLGAA